ncbi:nucleolar protein 6 isoform X2 [Tripterygium wilfordii]|uniref:nucleolar protein 6 isoform X2 n=1 Tax=Tripterygium wilfordii TaxID=458696 RepID=UPI0018F85040|nr:nucleolar protein 6 isoform X2 [Tripterygium wilfordii]
MDSDGLAATDPTEIKVGELLKEVVLDHFPAFSKLVDDTVSAIKRAIAKIPDDLKVTADEAPGFVRDIGADKVEFKFKKPKYIEIGGSYSIQCVTKPELNVDLFVRLPKECFLEKDYLNYRYHAKRCLYLCIIKKYMKRKSSALRVEWSTLQNEARKPVLLVFPAEKLEVPGFFVRIIPTAPSLFNISKLNVKRNNVRALNQGDVLQPTPIYNSSILEDMFLEENAEFVRKTFHGLRELREALILLKVWARRRSSIHVHDCLNGFLISIILAYLATHDKINNSLKAVQIVRITLDFLATSKLWSRGLYFKEQGQDCFPKEERMQYKEIFPVVICDSSSHVNLAYRMTSAGFIELQDEAHLALKCIQKCIDGGFDELFMTKVDFPAKYDYCIRLKLQGNSEVYASGFCLDDECWRLYERKVYSLLRQGLTDRVNFIRVVWRNTASGCGIENGLSTLDREQLLIGISVSSVEKAFRVVDVGPNAENKDEALKFRKFWGEKAELRRFKDGTIAESTDSMSHSGGLLGALEVLSKRLRLIEDIPLRVSSVQPLDSAFRLTSVFLPEPHPLVNEKGNLTRLRTQCPSCIQPLEVMIQLEGSGNWPMDDIAIKKTKTAFLLKIGESLEHKWGMTCTATEDDVDVFFSGYAFRLKILHERGLSLLKREVGSNQLKRVPSTDKKLFISGQHSNMINGLQGQYPIYGHVVRLAKRWVASHLFSACLVEEAVELLVAYLFLKPLPFNAPFSRITGFLRFLRLLADYDWTFSAMVVDINNDLTLYDKKEINDNFALSRKVYEENPQNVNPAMFLATAYDKESEAWTRCAPNSLDLRRLVAYARSSADLLTKLVLQDQTDSYRWECLFRTPLNNYDAVVLLHRDRLPYPKRLLFPSELNQGKMLARGNVCKNFHPFILAQDLKGSYKELQNQLLVNFDPLRCFIGDLEKEFPNTFKLWYDFLGGDAIGLTWEKPHSKKREREETTEDNKNPVEALKAVGRIGKGFVRSVYFLKAPRLS